MGSRLFVISTPGTEPRDLESQILPTPELHKNPTSQCLSILPSSPKQTKRTTTHTNYYYNAITYHHCCFRNELQHLYLLPIIIDACLASGRFFRAPIYQPQRSSMLSLWLSRPTRRPMPFQSQSQEMNYPSSMVCLSCTSSPFLQ